MWQQQFAKGLLVIIAWRAGLITRNEAQDALHLATGIKWRARAAA